MRSTSSTARSCARDAPAGRRSRSARSPSISAPTSKTLGDREPGLSAEGWFHAEHQVYPYGIHFAVVKVDPDTGGVQVERYVIAYDIGRAINPRWSKGRSSAASRKASAAR